MIESTVLSLGIIFILGFFFSRLIKKLKIPTITAYIILGILLSPNLFNLISEKFFESSGFFTNIVLGMIAFSLGEGFSLRTFKEVGKAVTGISITASIIPWIFVTIVFWFVFKQPFYIALIMGAIASATDPATTVAVTQEYKSKGEFTDTLLGIVAIDDAWALIIFGLSLSLAGSFVNGAANLAGVYKDFLKAFFEIGGSILLGAIIALLFNKLCRFIYTTKDRLIYTFGFLLLCAGSAIIFNLSVILSCMIFGTVLANTNRTSFDYFDSLREIDAPLYLLFFVLAGASLKLDMFMRVSVLTLAFILLRSLGKTSGAFFGARIVGASAAIKKYMGLALLPQAGVALGCALVAKHTIGGVWGDLVLSVTIAATVIFELVGPWITKLSLVRAGDISAEEEQL